MELFIRSQTPEERRLFLEVIQTMLINSALTMGQALRVLRASHLGVTRRAFAKMTGLSNTVLGDLENDTGNPTLSSVEQAFRPFGFRCGLIPVESSAVKISAPSISRETLQTISAQILETVARRPRRR
jgi:predicted transcriptional regulator